MTKKRILNVLLFAILTFLVVLFIFKPFQTSDLEEWSNEVSYDTYKDAINLLESSVENGRYTYYDFLEEVNMNYALKYIQEDIGNLIELLNDFNTPSFVYPHMLKTFGMYHFSKAEIAQINTVKSLDEM